MTRGRQRRWCARPSCRHAPSRHVDGACSCGCPGWADRWPHWWRRWVTETHRAAYAAWCEAAEDAACGYSTELIEWTELNPSPNLRDTLLALSGAQENDETEQDLYS